MRYFHKNVANVVIDRELVNIFLHVFSSTYSFLQLPKNSNFTNILTSQGNRDERDAGRQITFFCWCFLKENCYILITVSLIQIYYYIFYNIENCGIFKI